MKKKVLSVAAAILISVIATYAQEKTVYNSSSIEFLFSWSNASDNGQDLTGPVRFAPVFNFQNSVNKDFSDKFGTFFGLSVNNVGFIYDVPNEINTRLRVRTYNIGIPVGFKIGNMDGTHFFGGYSLEFPITYKEKKFVNEEKISSDNTWFSDRTPTIQQAVVAGFQLPQGTFIKFKYYFTDFYNQDYVASDGQGGSVKPYENFSGNAYVLSIGAVLFKGTKFAY